jgi:hypothetical protein
MSFLKKMKNLILPEDVDFFGALTEQSKITEQIINKLVLKYTNEEKTDILDLIKRAKQSRKEKLKLLEKTFITPVDREAISRSYSHLYWITLSVEHFINELDIYKIYNLKQYENIFYLLDEQISNLTKSYSLFNEKKYSDILKTVNKTIHLDNKLVLEYSTQLNIIFEQKDISVVLKHREILAQLKEISKRIHFCANQIEDIVFKVD